MAKDQDKTSSENTSGQSAEPKQTKRGRQSAAPRCPYHDKPCKSRRSDAYFTRYYCPVAGCTYMVKQPRPRLAQHLRREENEDFSAR